jgi:hypothetical protein
LIPYNFIQLSGTRHNELGRAESSLGQGGYF